ncbi:MAG: type II secretion system protein [Bacilli bacterium]
MLNKKGFTLIELLAVLSLLSIIMLIAIPNVLSLLDKNKRASYIEDGKQLVTLAEYEFRSNTSISSPKKGEAVILTLNCLDSGDLTNSPDGGEYDKNNSFVAIANHNGEYKYYVTLRDNNKKGFKLLLNSALNTSSAYKEITTNIGWYNLSLNGTIASESDALSYKIIYVCTG